MKLLFSDNDSESEDFGEWDWEDEMGDFMKWYNVLRFEINVMNFFGK